MSAAWDADLPPMEKLVLLALADCANDQGGCWPAVSTIVRKSGQGERTVRRCIQSLIEKGHLTQQQRTGTSPIYTVHPCQSGTPANPAPLPERQDTPARAAPKSSGTVNPKANAFGRGKRVAVPANWQPEEYPVGSETRRVIDGWPPGEFDAQLEQFKAHHTAKGNTFLNLQSAFSTWVLNTRKFGVRHVRPSGSRNTEAFHLAMQGLDPHAPM